MLILFCSKIGFKRYDVEYHKIIQILEKIGIGQFNYSNQESEKEH